MDLADLVQFVVPWEEGHEGEQLKKDAADAPDVHFVIVVPVGEETLRCSVPPGRDVFCERLFLTDAPATAEISQFYHLIRNQDILWFDVSMENTVRVHVFHRLDDLKHVVLGPLLTYLLLFLLVAFIEFIEVHVH